MLWYYKDHKTNSIIWPNEKVAPTYTHGTQTFPVEKQLNNIQVWSSNIPQCYTIFRICSCKQTRIYRVVMYCMHWRSTLSQHKWTCKYNICHSMLNFSFVIRKRIMYCWCYQCSYRRLSHSFSILNGNSTRAYTLCDSYWYHPYKSHSTLYRKVKLW
jgi:hypothetical protein